MRKPYSWKVAGNRDIAHGFMDALEKVKSIYHVNNNNCRLTVNSPVSSDACRIYFSESLMDPSCETEAAPRLSGVKKIFYNAASGLCSFSGDMSKEGSFERALQTVDSAGIPLNRELSEQMQADAAAIKQWSSASYNLPRCLSGCMENSEEVFGLNMAKPTSALAFMTSENMRYGCPEGLEYSVSFDVSPGGLDIKMKRIKRKGNRFPANVFESICGFESGRINVSNDAHGRHSSIDSIIIRDGEYQHQIIGDYSGTWLNLDAAFRKESENLGYLRSAEKTLLGLPLVEEEAS